MKNFSLFIAILSFGFLSAQERFTPNWEPGTEKVMIRTMSTVKYAGDSMESEEVEVDTLRLKIITETKLYYEVEYDFGADILSLLMESLPEADAEIKEQAILKMRFGISKDSGSAIMLNWPEVEDYTGSKIDSIKALIAKADTGFSGFFLNLVLDPILKPLSSKIRAEEYFESEMGMILLPYQRQYTAGDTILIESKEKNPFNPNSELNALTRLVLQDYEKGEIPIVFHQEVDIDMEPFLEMMKEMMRKMATSFASDSSDTQSMDRKIAEIDAMEMDMINSQKIFYNPQTTWVERIETAGLITGFDPKRKQPMRVEFNLDIEIN